MNPKILLAFLGGAALASGIVYMAVKPESKPVTATPAAVSTPVKSPAAAQPDPQAQPAQPQLAEKPAPEEQPSTEQAKPSPTPKRSPVEARRARGHVEHGRDYRKPVEVAQATPPAPAPQVATPAPAPSPATEPAPAPAPAVSAPPPAPEPPQPQSVTLTAGTPLAVRIGETLSTKRNRPGDTFLATLVQPLVVDGFVIAERGARCDGRIVEADPGGRVKGVAHLAVELTAIHTSDGQRVHIRTSSFAKDADTSRKTDAAKVGGGAALGAIIGAIAGGGRGAGLGTVIGGAAGAGDVMMTRGKSAELPVETQVTFRVQDPVTITEKLN